MFRCLAALAFAALLPATGCGSCGSDDDKDDADASKSTERKKARDEDPSKPKKKARPKACVQAEACCAEMADLRGQDPDLVCSGVKGVHTGDKCEEFHEGYAGVFEASGLELPEACIKNGAP